jgi:hypothetical protein
MRATGLAYNATQSSPAYLVGEDSFQTAPNKPNTVMPYNVDCLPSVAGMPRM